VQKHELDRMRAAKVTDNWREFASAVKDIVQRLTGRSVMFSEEQTRALMPLAGPDGDEMMPATRMVMTTVEILVERGDMPRPRVVVH
jgi:hypothetical protein